MKGHHKAAAAKEGQATRQRAEQHSMGPQRQCGRATDSKACMQHKRPPHIFVLAIFHLCARVQQGRRPGRRSGCPWVALPCRRAALLPFAVRRTGGRLLLQQQRQQLVAAIATGG